MSTTETNGPLVELHLRETMKAARDVPTLPVIYQDLFAKMQDPEVAVAEIAEIIARDQSLSAKILFFVNCAFSGYSRQIRTISRAVVILGFRAVRGAALASSVFDFFKDKKDDAVDVVDVVDFWRHSIAVATICKILAEELDIKPKEEAFVIGLLHDVGKLVERRYFDKNFREIRTVARKRHLGWVECEDALLQTDHASMGKAIFGSWNFPPAVIDAVQFHHNPAGSAKVPQLAALVHVADVIAYQIGLGAPGAWPPRGCSPEALKILGLTLLQTRDYHDRIRAEMDVSMEILKLVV